jgi:hypothetical protein
MYTGHHRRVRAIGSLTAAALSALLAFAHPATAASALSLGPRALQSLVTEQLFNRSGRWYLIDDGACFTYLDSPRAHLVADRLVLNAHLSSRLGQGIGNNCAGANFASSVTVSAKLRATDRKLVLDDIRIDRVDDESTRNALNLALQLDPDALPRTASIDVLELVRQQAVSVGSSSTRVDQFHILSILTRPDAVVVQFDVSMSSP